jgi:hypothetical protein
MNQKRYLGLELSGAKNSKTTIAVLEYYPKEKKVFLLDVHAGIGADEASDADEALIDTIHDHADGHPDLKLGVSVPLTLPPYLTANRKSLPLPKDCTSPEIKWMRSFLARTQLNAPKKKKKVSKKVARMKDIITPYTQRPVELWLRHEIVGKLPEKLRFEIDETMGGNKAPLTARMHFLKYHLQKFEAHEVLPKLTVALLMPKLKLTYRTMRQYRQLEDGAYSRQEIIEKMAEQLDIFIYDRDLKKLTQNIHAFDAFLCAYTVLLHDRQECVSPPKGFPTDSGWVRYPKSPLLDGAADLKAFEDNEDED